MSTRWDQSTLLLSYVPLPYKNGYFKQEIVIFNSCIMKKGKSVLFNNALKTFIYGYIGVCHMVEDHKIIREETRCHHLGYSFLLAARDILYASSHRQDDTYHSLCYTSHGAIWNGKKCNRMFVKVLSYHRSISSESPTHWAKSCSLCNEHKRKY